jgi:hypothetical protein
MDGRTMTSPPAQALADLLPEQYRETAFWLALEVLQLDPVASDDPELTRRLVACQQRIEERLRARDRHAGEEHRGQPG